MWVAVTGPVGFMCISKMDGAGVRRGGVQGGVLGGGGERIPPPLQLDVMAATRAPSDDKNAIIMASE